MNQDRCGLLERHHLAFVAEHHVRLRAGSFFSPGDLRSGVTLDLLIDRIFKIDTKQSNF